jgi:hypothetical protein
MIKMAPILKETYAWKRIAGQPLPTLRDVQEAYKQTQIKTIRESESPEERMSGLINIYHMYKDGEVDKRTFYSLVGILPRHEKEELLAYINREKFDGTGLDPDGPMQEAYDADGVEEAKDKKAGKKSKRWQDNDGDGKWYEKGDDVSESEETDASVLNMRESFWARAKGNLHGHEYILRETFRK